MLKVNWLLVSYAYWLSKITRTNLPTPEIQINTKNIYVSSYEMFEDAKRVIRSCKWKKDRQYTDQKGQNSMINEIIHRKLD